MDHYNPQQEQQIGCAGPSRTRRYNIFPQMYTAPHNVNVDKGCNGFTVKNTSATTTALLNGVPILPLESVTFGGNENEIYVGRIDISFVTPGSAANQVWVIQKFYMD